MERRNESTSLLPSSRVHGVPPQLIDASLRLSTSANELQTSTEKLSQESAADLAQINDTSSAVDEIVESIRQVAENTSTSAKVAEEARETAIIGSQAVSNTIQGMQRIRNQVQSTSKRIKQLGESTQQIGEIVQLISDVADRTSLLALNASIQAAMAGEAGQGFGVVAEEVERLSQRCNEATKQMAKLVKSVQSETSEAIAGMEESIAEVVEGSKLASQAGEALADIDAVSVRLAELINTISNAAKQQARGGLLASRSMNEISAVIHDKALGTKQAAESVTQLASLASGLFATVQRWEGSNGMQPRSGDSDRTRNTDSGNERRKHTSSSSDGTRRRMVTTGRHRISDQVSASSAATGRVIVPIENPSARWRYRVAMGASWTPTADVSRTVTIAKDHVGLNCSRQSSSMRADARQSATHHEAPDYVELARSNGDVDRPGRAPQIHRCDSGRYQELPS